MEGPEPGLTLRRAGQCEIVLGVLALQLLCELLYEVGECVHGDVNASVAGGGA